VTRDFTFDIYEKLLHAGHRAGYEHITMQEYLAGEELPEQFIIHRHDVDRKPENSLAMARLEADHGISTTYYFRTINKTFKPEIISEIESLGHEIGYHYEDMDRASGDVDEAHRSFSQELARVRQHATVDTVCMHGNPLTAYDNRDMWDGSVDFESYGLLGEAYLSTDFVDVTYFSDTGRTWQDGGLKIKDHTVGDATKETTADSTMELISLIEIEGFDRACLLSHPNRWANSPGEYIAENIKDRSINAVKRGLNLVR
jgi:hypothetical protein